MRVLYTSILQPTGVLSLYLTLVPFGVEDEGDSGVLLTGDLRSEGWSRPEPDPEDGELSEEAEFSCVWGEVLGRT